MRHRLRLSISAELITDGVILSAAVFQAERRIWRVSVPASMRKPKRFFVYIMTNGPRDHVLYIGVTGSLVRRVFEHKNKLILGFASRYNLTKLVYYETFFYPDGAIAREKQLKGRVRRRKIELIESTNPHWYDLAARWYNVFKPTQQQSQRSTPDPSLRLKNGYAQDDAG